MYAVLGFVSSKEFEGENAVHGKRCREEEIRCCEEPRKKEIKWINNWGLDMDIWKHSRHNILSAFGLSWNSWNPQPGFIVHICRLRSSALKSSLNLSTIYIRLITKMEFGPDCCVINLIHSNKHKLRHLKDLKCRVNISKDFEIAGKGWCFIFGPPLI